MNAAGPKLIVVEGIDGAGKTTLAHALAKRIAFSVATREPTDGPVGALIRRHARELPNDVVSELFLMDRIEHMRAFGVGARHRTPGAPHAVICDRYVYSTAAYQSISAGPPAERTQKAKEIIQRHYKFVPRPDLTLVLRVDPETAAARCGERAGGGDALAQAFENLDTLRLLAEAYEGDAIAGCSEVHYLPLGLSIEETVERAFRKIEIHLGRDLIFLDEEGRARGR